MPSLTILLLQIGIILVAAWGMGRLFRFIRQPQVMGEMVAGILLGPSLLGWLWPGFSAALFPPASLGSLQSLSQIGLLVFMFLIGLELNPKTLRERGHTAIVTSHASILAPFLLGSVLALYLYPRLSDDSVSFTHFALFLGTAMSITAFPVLARILTERNMLRSHLGTVTIACAAVDDVTAWCILAGVVVMVRVGEIGVPIWFTILGSALYVAAMLTVVRRVMGRLETAYYKHGVISKNLLALILLLICVSGSITEWLGIHALFGSFLIGAIMPKDSGFVRALTEKLEALVLLLLPLFFAFTGLRTKIGLVTGAEMWFYCALIITVAIAGKFAGSMFAARMTGMAWKEASALGVLMNTRGLMELVVLNIGLDIGVISPAVFAMMVIMALVTTFMTTPLLELIFPVRLFGVEQKEAGAVIAA